MSIDQRICRFSIGLLTILFALFILFTLDSLSLAIAWIMGWIFLPIGTIILIQSIKLPGVIRSWILFEGVATTLLGIIFLFFYTYINVIFFSYFIVAWFITTSIIQIYAYIIIRPVIYLLGIGLNIVIILISLYGLFTLDVVEGILLEVIVIQFICYSSNRIFSAVFGSKKKKLPDAF